jgi:hypothetical protein
MDILFTSNYEKKLYFVTLLFHWRSSFYVLAFDYVLSQLCFLPTISQVGSQTRELRADMRFHNDVAVYDRESSVLYCAVMFKCEDLYVTGQRLQNSNYTKCIGNDT